ncbi:unnamed protein product [Rhizophagus irregularis]|nr:unnamed protein product [Rhizophagus irregularis]
MQNEWKRIPNREVALKCLYNSQNITNKILNKETEFYSIKKMENFPKIYGISQNPDTKNYILYLVSSQNNITNEFLNKIKSYLGFVLGK